MRAAAGGKRLMSCRGMLIIAIVLSAGTASAQQCPECAATDVCIGLYHQGMKKLRADLQKNIREYVTKARKLDLPKGEELIARGTEQMEKNTALVAKLEHVDGLKECLSRIR